MSETQSPVLVTGAAGFIGFHVAMRLLDRGVHVIGLDNLNDYYDVRLKQARLAQLTPRERFSFVKLDLSNRQGVRDLFAGEPIRRVVHLAAQAGVRYSLVNPHAYTECNIEGFMNILEGCRHGRHPVGLGFVSAAAALARRLAMGGAAVAVVRARLVGVHAQCAGAAPKRPECDRLGRDRRVLVGVVAGHAGRLVGAARGIRAVSLVRHRQARAGGLGRSVVQGARG